MTDKDQKADPFKPAQPQIPGVPDHESGAPDAPKASPLTAWLIAGVAVALVVGLVAGWRMRASAPKRAAAPFQPAAAAAPASDASPPPAAPVEVPTAPGPVATTDELAKPWAGKRFNFRSDLGELVPAMVVHLPGGGYLAFSLQEPYGHCELEFVADTAKLRDEYAFTSNHPMVTDPCTHTVYDLLRYGSSPKGLVRGEIVVGTGPRPPLAIEVSVEGSRIVAGRME
jgi:hypothetical protein